LAGLVTVSALTSWLAGGWSAVFVFAVAAGVVAGVAALLPDRVDAAFVARSVIFVFSARAIATAILHIGLLGRNAAGAMFEDDFSYVSIAASLARAWHGESVVVVGDQSTMNAYVRAAGALFWLIGPNVAALKLANTAFAVIAALFVYRTTFLVAGRSPARAALWLLLVFPSIGLWSSLALKEGFSLFCSAGVVWSVTESLRRARLTWLVATVLFALPLQDTRTYLFQVLVIAWPLALLLSRVVQRRPPIGVVAASAVVAVVLLGNIRPGLAVTSSSVGALEALRGNMAEGARSAIVESTKVFQGSDGDCFTIAIPGRTQDPTRSPDVQVVRAGTTFTYVDRQTTDIEPPRGSVRVQPGDIACIGHEPPGGILAAFASPEPTASLPVPRSSTPPPLPRPSVPPVISLSQTGSMRIDATPAPDAVALEAQDDSFQRNLAYLPQGVLLVIAAPFPWQVLSPSRLLLIPEFIFWYPTFVFGLIGIAVAWRRRHVEALYVLLVGLAVAGILSLAEGNLGTLVRHRSMLVPFAAVFTSLGFCVAAPHLRRALFRRQRSSEPPAAR